MTIERCVYGFMKITLPDLGIVTYASDLEDAEVAIAEAIELHRITTNQLARISKNNDK